MIAQIALLLALSLACRPEKPASSPTGSTDSRAGSTDTSTDTSADTSTDTSTDSVPLPDTPAEQCALVCARYDQCGCGQRCSDWCASYLDYFVCQPEIDALIACAATHPDPCAWNEEAWPDITCAEEILAFSGCSGNSFFPLPGAPESSQ